MEAKQKANKTNRVFGIHNRYWGVIWQIAQSDYTWIQIIGLFWVWQYSIIGGGSNLSKKDPQMTEGYPVLCPIFCADRFFGRAQFFDREQFLFLLCDSGFVEFSTAFTEKMRLEIVIGIQNKIQIGIKKLLPH